MRVRTDGTVNPRAARDIGRLDGEPGPTVGAKGHLLSAAGETASSTERRIIGWGGAVADVKQENQPLSVRLIGRWNLISFEEGSGESTGYPLGRDAIGQIVYDLAGNMAVQIMKAHRPLFASGDQGVGTMEELSAALSGYVAYCGTYSVDETARLVTHSLTMSLFPNWVGTEQRRHVVLNGDQLTLSTPPMPFSGLTRVYRAVWRRALY
jgi:hypothetical protein